MPISVKASDVSQKFNTKAASDVERLVAGEIGEVKHVLTAVLTATERVVDHHFATQEANKQPPYPVAEGRANYLTRKGSQLFNMRWRGCRFSSKF